MDTGVVPVSVVSEETGPECVEEGSSREGPYRGPGTEIHDVLTFTEGQI